MGIEKESTIMRNSLNKKMYLHLRKVLTRPAQRIDSATMKERTIIPREKLGPSKMYSVRLPVLTLTLLKQTADKRGVAAAAVIREGIEKVAQEF